MAEKIGTAQPDCMERTFWEMRERLLTVVWIALCVVVMGAGAVDAALMNRYFHSGNGTIHLVNAKNGVAFDGRYRAADGSYEEPALEAINRVFGAEYGQPVSAISLRLIEFLDFLEDRLEPGARILIVSGWRSPQYNKKLRDRGGIVAKASLHQYGMAADIIMEGVPSKRVWDYVRELGYGGVGYYHDKTVHIDVGPARYWDDKSSKVRTNISDHNKRIGLVTEYDVYAPGEDVILRFIRMTAFPIGVAPKLVLESDSKSNEPGPALLTFRPWAAAESDGQCLKFSNIADMAGIRGEMPKSLLPGRYRIRARFCDKSWLDMPTEVVSPPFEVAAEGLR